MPVLTPLSSAALLAQHLDKVKAMADGSNMEWNVQKARTAYELAMKASTSIERQEYAVDMLDQLDGVERAMWRSVVEKQEWHRIKQYFADSDTNERHDLRPWQKEALLRWYEGKAPHALIEGGWHNRIPVGFRVPQTNKQLKLVLSPMEPLPPPKDPQAYGPPRRPKIALPTDARNALPTDARNARRVARETVNSVRMELARMQMIVDEMSPSEAEVPESYVLALETIENAIEPPPGPDEAMIAAAVMQHYGECGVCVSTIADSKLVLLAPKYNERQGIHSSRASGRDVGWLRSECELERSRTSYSHLQPRFEDAVADIRSQQDLTWYVKEYLSRCKEGTRLVLIPVELRGYCTSALWNEELGWTDTTRGASWWAHANQLVIDLVDKTICLNDPNITSDDDIQTTRKYQYIADFIGWYVSDFIEKKKEDDGEHYTFTGHCRRGVDFAHGGTCRYADQMAIFDERVQTDTRYYMQRLVWVVKELVNIYTTHVVGTRLKAVEVKGDGSGKRKRFVQKLVEDVEDVATWEQSERAQMTCPENKRPKTSPLGYFGLIGFF